MQYFMTLLHIQEHKKDPNQWNFVIILSHGLNNVLMIVSM